MSETKQTQKTTKQNSKGHESIFAALSAFQGGLKPIPKSAKVDYKTKSGERVNFNYAPLGEVMKAINPLLKKHGLSVRFEMGHNSLECIVTHETASSNYEIIREDMTTGGEETDHTKTYGAVLNNEIRSGKLPINTQGEMKEIATQLTYARRYTLGLALGISTEDDTDVSLIDKERAQATESFAFSQAKQKIEQSGGKELDKQLKFIRDELGLIKGGKSPKIGLKKEQYEQLLSLGEKKEQNLSQNEQNTSNTEEGSEEGKKTPQNDIQFNSDQ